MSNGVNPAIFKAYDIRGIVPDELNADLAYDIGRAFADFLPTEGVVAVGRDMRPDSAELSAALVKGLREQGRDVWDIGEVTSDMIYFAVGAHQLAGGVVVTASHNPGAYNGIKFYRDGVKAVGLDSGLADIRDAVMAGKFKPKATTAGSMEQRNITEAWVKHCLTFIDGPLKPFKIAIDAGNGMAGAILPHLEPHHPLTITPLYYKVDGSFPNHEANPQKLENLEDLIKMVRSHKLDFGVAFDGDGDRAALVDDKGRPVSGSDFIALVARHYLGKYPGSEVVHEVRTSRAARELVVEWGGKPHRTKAGRVSIGTIMRERGAPFGGETTGHIFFKENYYADSGLIAMLVALVAISEQDKPLSAIMDEYHRYPMIPERNIKIDTDPSLKLEKLAEAYKDFDQDRLDGLSVEDTDWWFNIRASNTEPVMRLNAEAKTQAQLDEVANKVIGIIQDAT